MKEEIIEYYFGDVITPKGRPLLVIVGQEFDDVMRCEKFIFFEEVEGNHVRIGEEVTNSNLINKNKNLEFFLKKEGLEHSKSIIYNEAYKGMNSEDNIKSLKKIKKINLRKSNQNAFLLYMKRRSINQLNWIQNNTESRKLHEIIDLYKSFQKSKIDLYYNY